MCFNVLHTKIINISVSFLVNYSMSTWVKIYKDASKIFKKI